jgi:hypothetical protein
MIRSLIGVAVLMAGAPAGNACTETTTTTTETYFVDVPVTTVVNEEVVTDQQVQVGVSPVTVTSTITRLIGYDRVITEDVYENRAVMQWYVSQHTNWYQNAWGGWAALTCSGHWPWDPSYGWLYGEPYCGGHDFLYSDGVYHAYHSHEDVWAQQVVGVEQVLTGTRSYVQRFDVPPGTPVYGPYTFTWVRLDPVYETQQVVVLVPTVKTTIEREEQTRSVTVPVNRCVRPT